MGLAVLYAMQERTVNRIKPMLKLRALRQALEVLAILGMAVFFSYLVLRTPG